MLKTIRWRKSQQAEMAFWKNCSNYRSQFSIDKFWENELHHFNGKLTMEDFEGKDVLEIGCGPTGMIHYIPGYRRVGLDSLIEEYRRLDVLKHGGVEHVLGNGERLPFKDEAFHVIICFNVLDHTQIPESVCREMYRVLRRSGRVIFHCHFIIPLLKPLRTLLDSFDKPHPWHFTSEEINKLLSRAGFTEHFSRLSILHWPSRSFVKNVIGRAVVRDYFALLEKV